MIFNAPESSGIKVLFVIGEIDEGTSGTIIPELLETDFEKNNIKELHFYICSEGGYLTHCFAIIDLILAIKKQFNLKIVTYGLGEIASGGFFLFLLGDKRILFPTCRVYVHEHITFGDESQTYSERLKADKTIEKELYKIYSNYTATQLGISKVKAKRLLAKKKYLTAKEIKDYSILGDK